MCVAAFHLVQPSDVPLATCDSVLCIPFLSFRPPEVRSNANSVFRAEPRTLPCAPYSLFCFSGTAAISDQPQDPPVVRRLPRRGVLYLLKTTLSPAAEPALLAAQVKKNADEARKCYILAQKSEARSGPWMGFCSYTVLHLPYCLPLLAAAFRASC